MKRLQFFVALLSSMFLAPMSYADDPVSPADIQSGTRAAVNVDKCEFYVRGKVFVELERGREFDVSQIKGSWAGIFIEIDGKEVGGWVRISEISAAKPKPPTPDDPVAVASLMDAGIKFETNADGNVATVNAAESKITDADLAKLKGLPKLVELDLTKTGITAAGLKTVSQLKSLVTLYLDNTSIDNDGLAHLKDMRQLESLSISKTKVTGLGFQHLVGLTNLLRLNLSGLDFKDEDLVHLKGLIGLETVAMQDAKITGAGFANFTKMKDLITLNLNDSTVTDALLEHLTGLKKLRLLYVRNTQITQDGADKLDEATSGLAIFRD
ncbi:MAG: hypothetical protein O3A00_12820 [Planctomycetota bacterium]|nr:hypothetical protein [Planctomycetota bacterium]